MFLKEISVVNYKNIVSQSFQFDTAVNCFVGYNGIGKTNLLDAIYHLGVGKSYFNPLALQNIRHGEDFYLIEGVFANAIREEQIVCSTKRGQKKIIKCNGKIYDRIADHVGKYPMVVISPSDRDLIVEGSDTRRRFLDSVIGQFDMEYLDKLMRYNRVLSQRNALLKHFATQHAFDRDTLELFDAEMVALGEYIYGVRNHFMTDFVRVFQEQYRHIAGSNEVVDLQYDSPLHRGRFADLLRSHLEKDRLLHYSGVGIHKDDLVFGIEGYPIKKYGSQGQQKSFLTALKLTQFEMIKRQSGIVPILLLDDIFDKLDDLRVSKLVSLVTQPPFGQLFITDTNAARTEAIVKQTGREYRVIEALGKSQ